MRYIFFIIPYSRNDIRSGTDFVIKQIEISLLTSGPNINKKRGNMRNKDYWIGDKN